MPNNLYPTYDGWLMATIILYIFILLPFPYTPCLIQKAFMPAVPGNAVTILVDIDIFQIYIFHKTILQVTPVIK